MRSSWRRIRVHLSTAIILMFAAGGMLLLNLQNQRHSELVEYFGPDTVGQVRGWPWIVQNYVYSSRGELFCAQMNWIVAPLNAAVAMLVLAGVAVFCEYLIRQRSNS